MDTQMARGRFLKSSRETAVTLPSAPLIPIGFARKSRDEPIVSNQSIHLDNRFQ
jgi:hypothetical protein